MLRFLPALFLLAFLGCSAQAPVERVSLVPTEAMAALLPDSVGSFQTMETGTYRGYFADSTGDGFGVATVARVYNRGAIQLAVNLSSTDDLGRYLQVVTDNRGRVIPDSIATADSVMASMLAKGWTGYVVAYGWLFAKEDRAVEVKSLVSPDGMRQALSMIDLDRLAALEAVDVEVDTTFTRVVE